MKKLLASLLLFLCLHLEAQISVKYIYQYPNASVPPTNALVLLDPGNGHYENSTIAQIALQISTILNLTNGTFVVTNITVNNIYATTNISQYSFATNLFISNTLINTNVSILNLTTNNTFVNTNVSISTQTNYNNYEITTNLFATNITSSVVNVTSNFFQASKGGTIINTNVLIATSNAFFNNTYVTNITIVNGGALTNLAVTPSTLAWWDINKAIGSIPNAAGFLTNDGVGNIGFNTVLAVTEIDAQNAYLTNTFLFITNAPALATDGNGKALAASTSGSGSIVLLSGSPTSTNETIKGSVNGTNALSVTVNRVDITNNLGGFTQTGVNNTNTGTVGSGGGFIGNITGNLTGNVTGDLSNGTNNGFGLKTNNLGGGAFVFGGPGTGATLYDTNITAATTLKPFDITACGSTAGGMKIYSTCSGGTDRILTFPNGCSGAGLGTPPAVTITNAKGAFFDVIYKPGAVPVTNVFWSPVF